MCSANFDSEMVKGAFETLMRKHMPLLIVRSGPIQITGVCPLLHIDRMLETKAFANVLS